MKELWPLEENKYIFLFYGETLLNRKFATTSHKSTTMSQNKLLLCRHPT